MFDILDPSTWSFPALSGRAEGKPRQGFSSPLDPRPNYETTPREQPASSGSAEVPLGPQLSPAEQLKHDLAQIRAANADPDTLALFTVSQDRGNSLTANNQVLADYRGMTPLQFQDKYGQRVYQEMVSIGIGGHHVRDLAASDRGTSEHVKDSTLDVLGGLTQGAIGLQAMHDQMVPDAFGGDWLRLRTARNAQVARETLQGNQSRELNRLRYVDGLRTELDRIDNERLFEQDRSDDEGLIDTLESYGQNILRDAGAGMNRWWEEPAMLGSATGEGVGTLVLGGPVARTASVGAQAANRAITRGLTGRAAIPTAARAVDDAIAKAAFPLTIAGMEGGSASNEAINEVMNMPEAELAQSEEYQRLLAQNLTPQEAREKLALEAGSIALAVTAPVAGATGKLVQRFEMNPLSRTSPGGLLSNMAREGVEETIQSGASQTGVNLGVQISGADPDRRATESVGSAAAQGGLAGSMTPVATQGPLLAIEQAAKAAGVTLMAPIKALSRRRDRIVGEVQQESTVNPDTLRPAMKAAADAAESVAQGVQTLASEAQVDPNQVETFVANLVQASQTRQEDLEDLPDAVGAQLVTMRDELGRVPDRFEVLLAVAGEAMNETAAPLDRAAAAAFLIKHVENNRSLFSEALPEFLDNVPEDRAEYQAFQRYAKILTRVEQVPQIQQAMKWARESMQLPEVDFVNLDFASAEGQSQAQRMVRDTVNVAAVAPQAVPLETAEQILMQADEGNVTLSTQQRQILQSTRDLLNAARIHALQNRAIDDLQEWREARADVDREMNQDDLQALHADMIKVITDQIETSGGPSRTQLSLRDHVAGISHAVQKGDMDLAKVRAQHLHKFAQSHINKVAAANESTRRGDNKNVPYQAYNPTDDVFYESRKGWGVNVGNAGSERATRSVFNDAVAVARLASDVARNFPEFGLRELTVPELLIDAPTDVGSQVPVDEVKEKGSSTPETDTQPQATTSRDDVGSQEELPPSQSQPVSEAQVKETETPAPQIETVQETQVEPEGETQVETQAEAPLSREEVQDTVEQAIDEAIEERLGPAVEPILELEPVTEVAAELVEPETVTPLDEAPSSEFYEPPTIQEVFSSLARPAGTNWFHKAFRLPKKMKSRMQELFEPLRDLYEMLGRSQSLFSFMGNKTLPYDVTGEDAANVRRLLVLGNNVLGQMKIRLRDKVTKDGLLQKLENGEDLLRFRDLRVINLLDRTERGYRYNQRLVETAVMAGLDWAVNLSNREKPVTAQELAEILGMDEADAAQYVSEFNKGMSLDMAKRSLAQHIVKFWGLETNRDARAAYAKGIGEAIAAEVLHGLDHVGLVELRIKKADADLRLTIPGITDKSFNRVWFDTRPQEIQNLIQALNPVHDLLSDIVLIDKEIEGYAIGSPVTDVDDTQLRNPMVRLSRKAKRALENAQKTPYLPNHTVYDFYQAIGEEAYVTLMSGAPYRNGDLTKTHEEMGYNKGHWESIKGRQRGLVNDFRNITRQMEAVRKHGRDVPTFYKHHNNKLGRTQMDGPSNPQTSKTAREIFMPTRAVLDLSQAEGPAMDAFLMTIGQGIGLKTEKLTRAEVVEEVTTQTMTEGGSLFPLVQEMQAWLRERTAGRGVDLPRSIFDLMLEAQLSDHGLHSLLSVARYLNAREDGADLSQFETFTYLEADGKTNGPINALMLLGHGPITAEWLRMVAKGGAFFGRLGKSLNSHDDKADLYQESAVATQTNVVELGEFMKGTSPEAHAQFLTFQRFLAAVNADVQVSEDGEIVISRGLTKNPLTITIYGSGAKGIAGKIADELATVIYETLTESIRSEKPAGELLYGEGEHRSFMRDLQDLVSKSVHQKTGGEYFVKEHNNPLKGDAQSFALTPAQANVLRANVKTFLVDPMRAAIDTTVMGHVASVTSRVQKATQIQSIILKGMFITEVTKRLAKMKANPDAYEYRNGDFLSEKELDEIRNDLMRLSPVIDTGTQGYMLSGGETSNLFDKTTVQIDGQPVEVTMPRDFSRSLTSDMSTPAFVYGPTLAGVAAIPTLVVGSGDGQMMMNFLAENSEAAQRVLHVFDGLNLPADAIDDYSTTVNKAVFQTWTTDTNPVRAVANSMAAFLAADPIKRLFPDGPLNAQQRQALKELSQVFHERFDVEPGDILGPFDAQLMLENIMADLNDLADDIDLRRQVYRSFPVSVDQMASAESPYVNPGKVEIDPDATLEDIAEAMQNVYEELTTERNRQWIAQSENQGAVQGSVQAPNVAREDVTSPPVEAPNQNLRQAITSMGQADLDTGVQVLEADQLSALVQALPKRTTKDQKEVFEAAAENLRESGYTIVFGGRNQLDAWESNNNAERFIPGSNSHYGKIDPVAKIITISNVSVETLLHEMIHAATLEKVRAAYQPGSRLDKTDLEAVQRIEALMQEWLAVDHGLSNNPTQDAHRKAISTIQGYLAKGRMPEAVNEFMAWVLANQRLASMAKKVKVTNPVARILTQVLEALKGLFSRLAPGKKAPMVSDDLLSNLRFNARVLMATPSQVDHLKTDFAETALYQSDSFGNDPRLTDLRQKFMKKIVAWMQEGDQTLAGHHQRVKRTGEVHAARRAADQIATVFAQYFPGLSNMQGYSTFLAIQTALMTDLELNSNALSRIEDLYEHVIAKVEISDFRENQNPDDPNDIYQAQQKFNALEGVFIDKTDAHGRSSLMSSFLALAMTDDSFRKILSRMEKPKREQNTDGTLDARIENIGMASMDRLGLKLAGERSSDRTVQEALDRLTAAMIENVGDQRTAIETSVENGFMRIERKIADMVQSGSGRLAEASAALTRRSQSRTVKAGASIVSLFATLVNEQKSADAALGMMSWLNRQNGWNTIRDTVSNILGRNKDNASVYDMITRVKSEVQQVRQQFRDKLPGQLAKAFSKPPTETQWTAMFKALGKTDLAAIAASRGLASALELISNPRRVTSEIARLEDEIRTADPTRFDTVKAKAEQLAHYLNTGEHGRYILRNAEAIARLLGQPFQNLQRAPAADYVAAIDQLVTLYALQGVDQYTRDQISELMGNQKDREGVEFVMAYLIGQRNDELAKIDNNAVALLNHWKGDLPSEPKQRGSLRVANDDQHLEMVMRGYQRVGAYEGSPAEMTRQKRSYYFSPVSSQANFSQGVMQTVHQTVSGIDPETGFSVHQMTAGRIQDPRQVRTINRAIHNRAASQENLLPVFDHQGRVVAYERGVDPKQTARMRHKTNLAESIGAWRGRQAEELLAQEVNRQLVDVLHETWLKAKKEGKAKEFVNVLNLGNNPDPVLVDAARLIPHHAREHAQSLFGKHVLMVNRGQLLDALGARNASVRDVFTGETRWNPKIAREFQNVAIGLFGRKAYARLAGAEETFQELISNAKTTIVVRSVIVPVGNMVANMGQLLNRGVPLRQVVKGVMEKAALTNDYIKRRDRQIRLEAELRAAEARRDIMKMRKLENEIQSIKDSYRRMSIWPLIEAGEFSAIADGKVNTMDLAIADGRWTDWVESKIQTLPPGFRTTVRYGLLTRDTALFQGLAQAIQYGDFVSRAVLYDHLTQAKKMNQNEALASVNEAFVNYNRLAGRDRQYIESIGLMWFYNFKIRIMKEAVYTLRNHPIRSLLIWGAPIGSPISDNLATVAMEDRLGYSLGPAMGWNAPSLNPWFNLTQ